MIHRSCGVQGLLNGYRLVLFLGVILPACSKRPGANETFGPSALDEISAKPTVMLPSGIDPAFLELSAVSLPLPDKLGASFVPVGKVYDIKLSNGQNNFGSDFARIEYKYDKSALQSAGLLEEFQVFYREDTSGKWRPVSRVVVDSAAQKLIAYTNHFTPFVLSAAPTGGGNVALPPSCITADFPTGIGGSGNAIFTLIDENFKYYQDRNYFIQSVDAPSAENALTFGALGFQGAMAISTCNGQPPGSCGAQANHKLSTGNNYINFTAHINLDVYVMYDTRGGGNRNDTTLDATWLTSKGFTVDIKGDGGTAPDYFVETTDAVRYYAVYKKTYAQGQTVSLDGNRLGAADSAINTNYWVILKPAGNFAVNSATALCVAAPDLNPPAKVSNLVGVPGANRVILRWQNPHDPDFAGVVIRRSTIAAPADVNEGTEVTPYTVFSPESFRDESALPGTTYFYTVFALDNNQNRQLGQSTMVVTGMDTDGDGLTDAYEDSITYATNLKSTPTLADSDGDGIADGLEIAQGTDPTNPDKIRPVIDVFTSISPLTNTSNVVTFDLSGHDDTGITGYMVTTTATPPLGSSSNWSPSLGTYVLQSSLGTHTLYAWAKDAAGNVNAMPSTLVYSLIAGTNGPWARSTNGCSLGAGFSTIQTDANDNVYAVGSISGQHQACSFGPGVTVQGTANSNAVIVKYNALGVVQWARTVTTVNQLNNTAFNGVATDSAGNVYAVGYQDGDEPVSYGDSWTIQGSAYRNPIIVKYSGSGLVTWARIVPVGYEGEFLAVCADGFGRIYAAGYRDTILESSAKGVYLMGFDQAGDQVAYFGEQQGSTASFRGLACTDDAVYAVGSMAGGVPHDFGNGPITSPIQSPDVGLLIKYTRSSPPIGSLHLDWVRVQSASAVTIGSAYNAVAVDSSGSVIVAGYFDADYLLPVPPTLPSADCTYWRTALLAKYNSAGSLQWTHVPEACTEESVFASLAVDGAGDVFAVGRQMGAGLFTYSPALNVAGNNTNSNPILVRYNSLGVAQIVEQATSSTGGAAFGSFRIGNTGARYAAGWQYGSGYFSYPGGSGIAGSAPNATNPVLVRLQ